MPELIIIRGLPGSGKTTLAKELLVKFSGAVFKHYEADMWFEDSGYAFHPLNLPKAHAWCKQQVKDALSSGYNVIVSNTFTTWNEMIPYIRMAKDSGGSVTLRFETCKGAFKSVHNVPEASIQKMKDRWEE